MPGLAILEEIVIYKDVTFQEMLFEQLYMIHL